MQNLDLLDKYEGQATYQITVEGCVDQVFLSRINDLTVTHTKTPNKILSTLTGNIMDQEALSGVLNMLFDNRYKVISVFKIE